MGYGGYDLGQALEWDEAVITLIQTTSSDRQSFFLLHCYRGLPSDGLINRVKHKYGYTIAV